MITITRNIGKVVILFLNNTGNFFIFFTKVIHSLFKPWYFKNILSQMIFIGYFSLPVVSLTSFFTGGALALQRQSAMSAIPQNHHIETDTYVSPAQTASVHDVQKN